MTDFPSSPVTETARDALEQARAYIEHDVETQAPGWRTARAIIALIDAALSTEVWTEQDLAEAKAEAKELSDYFNQPAAAAAIEDPRSAPAGNNNGSDRGPRTFDFAQRTPDRESIARVLYECEKRRATNADAVIKSAFPRASDALLMEPWDECKDAFLSDADAVLAALADSSTGRHGACRVCGETADLKCGSSRFGEKTWACKDCWEPDTRPDGKSQ